VEKDTVGLKVPEKLPRYTYNKFRINSDTTNSSTLIRLTISKVKSRQSFSANLQIFSRMNKKAGLWM
jgi:hypothetical protein